MGMLHGQCWAVCLTWQGRTCHVGAFEDRVEAIAWSLHAIDEKAAGRRPTVVPSKGRQEAKKPTALAFTDAELREHAVGLVNRRKHVEGVGHDRRGDRWRAEIRFRGVAVQLGRHEQRADAICARLRAEVDKHEGRWPRDAIHPPARYSALLTGVSGGAGGAGGADGAGGTGGRDRAQRAAKPAPNHGGHRGDVEHRGGGDNDHDEQPAYDQWREIRPRGMVGRTGHAVGCHSQATHGAAAPPKRRAAAHCEDAGRVAAISGVMASHVSPAAPPAANAWQASAETLGTGMPAARPKAAEANTVPGALLGIWDAGKRKRKRACAFDALIALAQARTRSVA